MFNRPKAILMILLALSLVGVGSDRLANAAMVELTTNDLVAQSSDIVGARVLSIKSQWNPEKNFIFTTVTLQITESYKGTIAVSSTADVIVPGGEVDGVGLGVEHAAKFKPGENIIVFLRSTDGSAYAVTGWEQGKYTIEQGQVRERGIPLAKFTSEIREALK